jgi:type IV secretory pathway VirB2 component (pilin)
MKVTYGIFAIIGIICACIQFYFGYDKKEPFRFKVFDYIMYIAILFGLYNLIMLIKLVL